MDIPSVIDDQEKEFEKLVPLKSILGREYEALKTERHKQKSLFEESLDKMAYDTAPYRRANISLGRFLGDMLSLLHKTLPKIILAKTALEVAEAKAQNNEYGHGIELHRRSHQIIWTRFAIERYRLAIPKKERKRFKIYHPELWRELGQAWMDFRREIKRWQFSRIPYDGSQAMHLMIAFQVKARLLASAND